MPPHHRFYHRFKFALPSSSIARLVPLGVVALVLTGCASIGSNTDQAALDKLFTEFNTDYSYSTQADPLGAYLANRSQSDIRISYGAQSSTQDSSGVVKTALSFLGVKYRFGGENPNTGFDCSGLVSYVAEKSLGLKLPRQSAQMAQEGESVQRGQLEKGDLVFFNTRGARFSHVGIYLGDNKFVHAPRTGAVVRVEDMSIAYWKNRYNGARRLATAP